ncbi:MAG: family 78 glycoside hydrolase catalytic domain [Candidatus Thorarchaeota archaeon]
MQIVHLRCENLQNPLGIDELRPRLSWKLQSDRTGAKQTAYRIQCATTGIFDSESIVWDSSKVDSDQSVFILYIGANLSSRERIYWRVRIWDELGRESDWSDVAFWEMGFLEEGDWEGDWIDPEGEIDPEEFQPASLLRKEFDISVPIEKARLYITAHGLYEAWINGERVGNQYFTPGRTQYDKRLQYQVYDVTPLLQEGRNTVGIILGDGWWRGKLGFGGVRNVSGERIALLAQIEINSEVVATTDDTWMCTSNGPIRMSDLQLGEKYDSRMEIQGWQETGYDDSEWNHVTVAEFPKDTLIASMSVGIREKERFAPSLIRTPRGEVVYDFGQNIAGYIEMNVSEGIPTDAVIKLTHGESLDKDGNFTQEHMMNRKSGVFQCDTYIHDGSPRVYKPKFSVKGFRYVKVEIENAPDTTLDSIEFTSIAIYSDMEQIGHFKCSNELVNQLMSNALWSQKGNFLDIPTDCPQRERCGWTGDAQAFAFTGSLLMDTSAFLSKWMKDVALTQREDGRISNIVPVERPIGVVEGSAGWGDAAVIIPWTLWKLYGDTKILKEQYESMKGWVEYQQNRAKKIHWIRKLNPLNWTPGKRRMLRNMWDTNYHWGEWMEPWIKSRIRQFGGIIKRIIVSDPEVATAYLSYSNRLFSEIAEYLGEIEDASRSSVVAKNAAEAYQKRYLKKGKIKTKKQANIVRPLALGLVPPEHIDSVAKQLEEMVRKHDYHIGTGFLATPFLCGVLSDNGYLDTAYHLLLQTTPPSWLYAVTKDATTIWESWYGIKEDGEPFESLNHYSYGAVVSWLITTVVGIKPDYEITGFKHFFLEPKPGGGLSNAEGSFDSPYGLIQSSWLIESGKVKYKIRIPPNTTATVTLSGVLSDELKQEGIGKIQDKTGEISFQVQSGTYTFTGENVK